MNAGILGWLLAGTALAADPVVDGVWAEVDRAGRELRLPDAPGPYHIATQTLDGHQVSIVASLGGLVQRRVAPVRVMGAVVRTGTPALDNTNFDTFRDGTGSRSLVPDDHELAIRHDAWLLLDDKYKEAVEALAAKEAAIRRRADPDRPPDFAPGEPVVATAPAAPPFDPDRLEALARTLSAVFLQHPAVEWSQVFVDGETGRRVMLDTGGVRVIVPHSELTVRVVARVRADDGATQVDQVLHVVRTPDDLPAEAELVAEVTALAERLTRWRTLPVLDEPYVGPVLVADGAAVGVVRHLLAPALIGTPPKEEPPSGSRVVAFSDDTLAAARVKRRVLPSGWRVDDDPQRNPRRASSYTHDFEGQPAERVDLVVDGIVRGHLMSRIPSRDFPRSNGHGRAMPGDLVRAMPADLAVTAPRALSPKKLHKAALKLASDYGADHYLVVRTLRDPAIAWMDGGPLVSSRTFDREPALPPPIVVERVHRDGRRETLRGVSIEGLDLRAFREIAGAGERTTATAIWGNGNVFSGPNLGFPVTVTAPDLLFPELVVSPDPPDAERPPRLPSPLAEAR